MTTAFTNPAAPAIGDTACVGATTAATVGVVFVALVDRVELAEKVCGSAALADVVAFVAVATICTASTDAAGAVGVTTAADDDEFVSAAADVGCFTTGDGLADGALDEPTVVWIGFGGSSASVSTDDSSASAGAVSGELVCAPPLLLTVTPGATCWVDDVVPADVPVASATVFADPTPAETDSEPTAPGADAVDAVASGGASEDAAVEELVDDDSVDVPEVSAAAHP